MSDENKYSQTSYYEREVTDYARELNRELREYIQFKENPRVYEDNYGYGYDKYTSDFEEKLVYKIKEKLSHWRYVYTENIAIMELGLAYSEFINDSDEKQLYHNELLRIVKEQKDRAKKFHITKQESSNKYKDKVKKLEKQNTDYIKWFLIIVGVFIVCLVVWLFCGKLPEETQLISYIVTKITISITISITVFWIAKFFNRRIHENVHLIESHEHRALLLDTFDLLTQSVSTEEHKREILDKILTVLIEDPTECLNKRKVDKLPTNEIAELIKAIQPFANQQGKQGG